MMERLERYCLRKCCICGLDTYIISPQNYDCLLADRELLEQFYSSWAEEALKHYMQIAANVPGGRLYPAVVHHKNRRQRFEWEPVLCYQKSDVFYHVFYRDSWMCRECGHILHASIIMPLAEADAVFYSSKERHCMEAAPFFSENPLPKVWEAIAEPSAFIAWQQSVWKYLNLLPLDDGYGGWKGALWII